MDLASRSQIFRKLRTIVSYGAVKTMGVPMQQQLKDQLHSIKRWKLNKFLFVQLSKAL